MSCHGATLDEFIYEGKTVTCVSSNATAARYEWLSRELTVQYGSGGAYAYFSVTPNEAAAFFSAESTGTWVWDHLRVRGSKTAHRKPFRPAALLI